MTFSYFWPIALVVLSNIAYSVCAKSVPASISPLINVAVAYVIAAILCVALYYLTSKDADLVRELGKLNWASFLIGVVVIGLEFGSICAYRAGWEVSRFYLVQSVCVAVALIIVGCFGYREALTWNKLLGMGICLIGLYFINR